MRGEMSRKIAVRMDDITPDMNWENFRFFQGLFEEAGIMPLLGIVPENRDEKLRCEKPREDFYEVMRELKEKGYCFAIHGCYHLYTTKSGGLFPLNASSEFAGVSYEKQKEMLAFGKAKLKEQGIDADIFMAPAHSYDQNTLRALKEVGITKVTDGYGREPYRYRGITFYPISFLLSRSLKGKKGVTTLVLHANTVTEADKERYRKLFADYGKNMISYTEYLERKPVRRMFPGRVLEYLLAKGKFLISRIRH